MDVKIIDTVFTNNYAEKDGGGIKWNNIQPFILNSTFLNNTAIYGKDKASFPARLRLIIIL